MNCWKMYSMGLTEINQNSSVVGLTCSSCQTNIIYIKVNDAKPNDAPYKPDQFTCTECNQGFMQNTVKSD